MNKKNLLAVIVGFVASFLLGWLIFGFLLKDLMATRIMPGLNKPEEEFIWWAMILGNLCWIILLTWLLDRMNARDFMKGAMNAFWIGLLVALSYDMYFYSATNMYIGRKIILADMAASSLMSAVIGGVIGMMLGRGDKSATA